jgi:hypothetical protein
MAKTTSAKPRNDAYTGLLAISFLALVGATVLMAMDAEKLGKAPDKLNIQVPGATPGTPGGGLKRPDAGKADPVVPDPAEKKDPGMGRRQDEPGKMPTLPVAAEGAVVPVKAEEPADGPPLPVKPFVPPM